MANSVNPPLNNNTEVVTEDTSNQTDQAAVPEDTVEMLQLNINFTNTGYANLMNFIKALEDMNKSIIISDANISKVETGTGINGMMTLNIYCIPKLINSENDYLQFNQQYINGTDSLF
jgi:hypothetical protein